MENIFIPYYNLDSIFLECIFSGFDVCSKMAQFKMYEQLYFSFNFNELRYTEVETGCLHPCSYCEYQIVDKQVHDIEEGFGLYIAYGTLAVTVKREVQPPVYIFQLNKKKLYFQILFYAILCGLKLGIRILLKNKDEKRP